MASEMNLSDEGDKYDPYRANETTSNTDNWPVWHPQLSNDLNRVKDSAGVLQSYQSAKGTETDFTYYKKATITYYDLFDYGNFGGGSDELGPNSTVNEDKKKVAGAYGKKLTDKWSWDDADQWKKLASGIGSFKIADTTVSMSGVSSSTYYIYSSGKEVARAKFTVTEFGIVTVEYYLEVNMDLPIEVKDNGGNARSYTLKVGGIDTVAPSGTVGINPQDENAGFFATTNLPSDKKWIRTDNIKTKLTFSKGSDDSVAPYVWFMSVQKSDSPITAADIKYNTLEKLMIDGQAAVAPLAVGSLDELRYNFKDGTAIGYNSQQISYGVTGSGYYCFTLYLFDLAGNYGGVTNIYACVDYQTPDFTLTINGSQTIDSNKNGTWSNAETNITITFAQLNPSGNTIVFTTDPGQNAYKYFFSVNEKGEFVGISPTTGDSSKPSTITEDKKTANLYILTEADPTYVAVTFDRASMTFTMTFSSDKTGDLFADVMFQSTFTAYAGGATALTNDGKPEGDTAVSANSDNEWKDGVQVLIDRNAPNNAYFGTLEYFKNFDNDRTVENEVRKGYQLPQQSERVWHDSYSIDGFVVNLTDKLGATGAIEKYLKDDNDVRIYFAQALVTDLTSMDKLFKRNIENGYSGITGADREGDIIITGFTGLPFHIDGFTKTTDGVGTYTYSEPFGLTGTTPGMRVIYVWVVDEAGNVSPLSAYYVLADTTEYSVTAVKAGNKLTGDGTVISLSGGEGNVFHRGDKIAFDISINDGHVPFKMWKGEKGTGDLLLYNYTSIRQFFANETYKSYLEDFGEYGLEHVKFSYALDDPNSLGAMGGDTSLKFVYECRETVTFNVDTGTPYTALPLDFNTYKDSIFANNLKNNLNVAEKDAAFEALKAKYASADAPGELIAAPKDVGKYVLYFYYDKEDPNFVMGYKSTEDTADTAEPHNFEIRKAYLTVNVQAGTSVYGDKVVLSYTLEGLENPENKPENDVLEAEGIKIVLSLNYGNWDKVAADSELLPVGSYSVSASIEPCNNYDYNIHNNTYSVAGTGWVVSQRDITIRPVAAQKQYGDIDPDLYFELDEDQLTWLDWLTDDMALKKDAVLKNMFGIAYERHEGSKYLFNSNGAISRNGGSDRTKDPAGEYDFVNDISRLAIDRDNYNVTMDVTDVKFTITKRNVVLTFPSSNSMILRQGSDPNSYVNSVTIIYGVTDADAALLTEIQGILKSGDFYLAANPVVNEDPENKNFSKIYTYTILFRNHKDGAYNTDNYVFTLGEPHVYTFTILSGNAIIVSADVITIPYGSEKWIASEFTYEKYSGSIHLQSEAEGFTFDRVEWEASAVDATMQKVEDDKYLSVGDYTITLTNVKVYNGDAQLENYVAVNDFTLRITPVTVTVKPTIDKLTRVYGETDEEYVISFDITEIGGKEFSKGMTWGDYDYDTLYAAIRGTFSRAIFNSGNGNFDQLGTNKDFVTDGDYVVNTDKGKYYGLYTSGLTLSNTFGGNFVQTISIDDTEYKEWRFEITKKVIDLDVKFFRGINRSYDGTKEVKWGSTLLYDLFAEGLLVCDDQNTAVYLTFDSEYTDIGVPSHRTAVGIKISNIALAGDRAVNYVLGTIVNTAPQLGTGAPGEENDVLESNSMTADVDTPVEFEGNEIVVYIYYIDNSYQLQHIYIMAGSIGLYKTDFSIVKIYDNTFDISLGNITLTNREGEGGTRVLFEALDKGMVTLDEFIPLYSTNVGAYVTTIKLTFKVDDANGYSVLNNADATDRINEPDITIDNTSVSGAFVITIRNIAVRVNQKVLTGDDFESVTAVDRDYNGSTSVGVVYAYAADALATGDSMQSVGLTFTTNAESKNAGTHNVNFDAYNFADANYGLDFDSFKAKFGDGVTKVTIKKAKLLPNITFTDMVYNGLAELGYELNALTTVNYSEMLAYELAQMTLSGASILLSLNGEANANVMFRDGAVVAHNVMISGLTITSDGVDLNNYVLSGFRYVGSEYVAVADKLESGSEVDAYELLDALTVTQKPIAIVQNNVVIPDKVYDGTRNATVTINLSDGDIVESDSKNGNFSITATANFVRANVGSNIAISLSGIELVVNNVKDGADEATMLANYRLMPYTVRHYGNILARPVALEESETVINGIKTYGYLGEKVYDGSAAVRSGVANAGVDESGFISGESSAYAVQIRNGAYFEDKNVQLKRVGGAIQYDEAGKAIADTKLGAIYAPTLRNTMTGVVNYQLTYAATEPDKTATLYAYSGGGEIVVASSAPEEGVDKYYYELPVADKMIEKTAYEELAAKPNENADAIDKLHGGIVGYIEYNGTEGYAIDSKADVSGVDAVQSMDAMTYVRSFGKITQKQVFLRGTAISKAADSTAYVKPYDGTTKFFGVRDTDFIVNNTNGISGLVKGDDVNIAKVAAEFGGADTSTTYVQFNLAEIEGKDADNYYWTWELVTATLSASITKRDLTANLAGREMTYGTNIADLVAEIGKDITFSLGTHAVTYDGASFYMSFEEYVKYMIEEGAFATIAEGKTYKDADYADAAYIQQLKDMAYDLGSYVDAFEGAKGEYIRLGGNFESLPVATIMFKNSTSRPNAGESTQSYTLSGGYATNFNFVYHDSSVDGNIKVEVLPMELYVATMGGSFTKIYAGADPQFDITFFDANGNPSNFAPWETYTNVFIDKNGVDIGPVIQWVDSEGNPMGKYPDINKTYYAKVIAGNSYDEITNYKFHFVDALSEEDSKFYADFGSMKPAASTLNVVLPSADSFNISVVSDNTDVVFNGENHTPHVLAGLLEGDEVHYADSADHIAQLVGEHNGKLVVKRYIKVDADDPNNYAVEWTSPVDIRINITKASPQLTARNASASYNGRVREYPVLGSSYVQLLNQIAGFEFDELTEGMIEYTAEKLGADGNYSSVDSIMGAGTYRVTVFLTEAFEREYSNFAAESTTATVTISRAPIDISILEGNYEMSTVNGGATGVVKLASVYVDGRQYPIEYTIENHALTGSEFAITPAMLGVHFFRENVSSETDITGAGKYSFRITPNDASIYDNYEFIGADGILELTATTLTTTDDEGEVRDSLVFAEGSNIIANELIVRRVQKSTGTGEDLALYHAIEQFMPHIDNEASVSAVLRVSLKYDNVIITDTNGVSMTLSIRIPTDVKSDLANTAVYVQQPDGSLRKLLPAGASGEAGSAAEGAMGTYEFKDGVLTFTTDFLGAIVFVDVAPAPFPMWAVWTLVAVGALVLLFMVWLVITLIVRKIKLYHIDRIF